MFKFFTIIFLIYYTIRLMKPSLFVDTVNKCQEFIKEQESITDKKEKTKHIENNIETIMQMIGFTLLSITITASEVIYIFSAVEYGDKLITIGYIIWWLFILITGLIKSKIRRANGNLFNNIKKFSLWRIFIFTIDVFYFAYMYYAVFIK